MIRSSSTHAADLADDHLLCSWKDSPTISSICSIACTAQVAYALLQHHVSQTCSHKLTEYFCAQLAVACSVTQYAASLRSQSHDLTCHQIHNAYIAAANMCSWFQPKDELVKCSPGSYSRRGCHVHVRPHSDLQIEHLYQSRL